VDLDRLLSNFDHFLVDLWGVVWDGQEVFPEAIDFVNHLLDADKPLLFLSNCSELVAEELVARLADAGIRDAKADLLATSAQAMEPWFAENGLAGRAVYVFGGEAVRENVRRAGACPLAMPENGLDLKEDAESDCLIVGGFMDFTWDRLMQIATGVRAGGLRVVLPNPDKIVIKRDGRVDMPPGMVAHVIETALPGLTVERIGKPFPYLYDYAMARFGPSACRKRTLMIGDSIETDVAGAQGVGIPSLLLGQGVHQGATLDALRAEAQKSRAFPALYAETLRCDAEFRELDWRRTECMA